jgi:hypothetical protein
MTTHTTSSFPAVAGRLFWIFIGPFALAVCAFGIAGQRDGWLSPSDLIYVVVLAGMFIGRWIEFRMGTPLTATGEPATADDLRRYAQGLALLGLGIWVIANLIGNRAVGLG